MVGADDFVAIGHIGARPNEQRPIIGHIGKEPVVAIRHDLNVLGGDFIGDPQRFVMVLDDDDLAVVAPCFACGFTRRHQLEQAGDLPCLVSRASFSDTVSRIAGEFGPCSA